MDSRPAEVNEEKALNDVPTNWDVLDLEEELNRALTLYDEPCMSY